MLPIFLSQIVVTLSIFGLVTLVVGKLPQLRAMEISSQEQEKFYNFLHRRLEMVAQRLSEAAGVAKSFYLRMAARLLRYVKIISLKVDVQSSNLLKKVRSDIEKKKIADRKKDEALNGKQATVTEENSEDNGIFFDSLKTSTNHHKVNGKIKSVHEEVKKK